MALICLLPAWEHFVTVVSSADEKLMCLKRKLMTKQIKKVRRKCVHLSTVWTLWGCISVSVVGDLIYLVSEQVNMTQLQSHQVNHIVGRAKSQLYKATFCTGEPVSNR